MVDKRRLFRIGAVALAAVVLVAAVWVLGMAGRLGLPAPTGQYAVGRTRMSWVDANRRELLQPDGKREVIAEVWYPAKQGTGSACAYFPELAEVSAKMIDAGQLQSIEATGLVWVRCHGLADAEFADVNAACPVIVLSPGNGTNVEFYAAYGEELASRGFVVFGVNHPYDVSGVRLTDGSVATYRQRKPGDPEALRSRMHERVADVRFLVDRLADVNEQHSRLARRLDLGRIGVMGHSLGGMTAGEACRADDRFVAGLNIDGLHGGNPFFAGKDETPPRQPFAYIGKERTIEAHTRELMAASPRGLLVSVPDARHMDFADVDLFLPAVNPFERSALRVLMCSREQVVRFFEKWLR
jgi:pimeloyl-ACP methyl ester carboxylesterase